ncbi:MAG: succinylglutamate desuccinylase/aspartoacylase family protein [Acidobacteriota bacterium]
MAKKKLERKDPHRWLGKTVAAGEHRTFQVTVSSSYLGADITIPIVVWRGLKPGPSVFLTAAVHGDELNGTGAVHQLLSSPPFALRAGTLISAPVVNLLGFERHSRYLPDRRDLNRMFPGSSRGSLASRMARVIFDEIVGRADFGIDLHTAALHRTNFPNVRADLSVPALASLARAFGTELIVDSLGPSGSLRRSATKVGCPTLILEAGEVWKVEPAAVAYAVRGVTNALIHLGMVEGELERPPYQVTLQDRRWIRARHGGFLRFHVSPGELVDRHQPIATHTRLTGETVSQIKAPRGGIILSMTTLPSVAPGDPICHLAFPQEDLRKVEQAVRRLENDSLHEQTREDLATSLNVSPPATHDGPAKPPTAVAED